jgi:hypothetical protein
MSLRPLRSPLARLAIATATGALVTMASVVPAAAAVPTPGDNRDTQASAGTHQTGAHDSQAGTRRDDATTSNRPGTARPSGGGGSARNDSGRGDSGRDGNGRGDSGRDGNGRDNGRDDSGRDNFGDDDFGGDGFGGDGFDPGDGSGRGNFGDDGFGDDDFGGDGGGSGRFDSQSGHHGDPGRSDRDRRRNRSTQGIVTARNGLALRTAPTRGSRVIGFARRGEVVSIFCKTRGGRGDNRVWYLLQDRHTWAWGPEKQIRVLGSEPRWC